MGQVESCGTEVEVTSMRYNTNEPEAKTEVLCPYCESNNTELISLFGQQLLTVQYYCNDCHTPFERIKDDDVLNGYARRKEGQA
jgi:DNA-directed RNA polymerase subunit RPC12/RpoP